jgi:hypothetical protein
MSLHDVLAELLFGLYELEEGGVAIWACILRRDRSSSCLDQPLSITFACYLGRINDHRTSPATEKGEASKD